LTAKLFCSAIPVCLANDEAPLHSDVVTKSSASDPAAIEGKVIHDPILFEKWVIANDRTHPEWPAHMFAVNPEHRASLSHGKHPEFIEPQVIHAGKVVTLWMQDGHSRIEASGVVEEGGRLGEHIRVKFLGLSTNNFDSMRQHIGIVRGPLSVELLQ
jgi:hypothetical protein